MTMEKEGLVKLVEESGELIQIAAKKQTCMDSDEHWDSDVPLSLRMEREMADVLASIEFCIDTLGLDRDHIAERMSRKLQRFQIWHNDPLPP